MTRSSIRPRAGVQEAQDTLSLHAVFRTLDITSEGQIKGIKDGAKGVYLDDTPIQNPDGTYNFGNRISFTTANERVGLADQPYMAGFESAATEINVGLELKRGIGVTVTSTDNTIDAMAITIALPEGLLVQDTKKGRIYGTQVSFSVEKKLTNFGTWTQLSTWTIDGKSSTPYEETKRIQRPGTSADGTWQIRITRLTDDAANSFTRNKSTLSRRTEILDVKLTYPYVAYFGLEIDSRATNGSIPSRSAVVEGIIVKVPINYDPVSHTYSGNWNGQFKMAWTDNPAWILYDLIAHPRYGMGQWISESEIDQFSFYDASKYNDELVDTYPGGPLERRYTFNGIIFQREQALNIIQKVSGSFGCKVVWQGGLVTLIQDRPIGFSGIVNKANVLIGDDQNEPPFSYSSTTLQDRITAVNVAWNDPNDRYLQHTTTVMAIPEHGFPAGLVDRYGYNSTDLIAFGCTNERQAVRAGRWALESSLNQLEICSFKVSYENFGFTVGDVIKIYDEDYTGQQNGGRVLVDSSAAQLTLDRAPTDAVPGSKIDIATTNILGENQAYAGTITLVNGAVVSVTWDLGVAPPTVPAGTPYVITTTISPRLFRIVKITQEDPNVLSIESIEYDPSKYARIDSAIQTVPPVFSAIKPGIVSAPRNLTMLDNAVTVDNVVVHNALFSWERPASGTPVSYVYSWRVNSGPWTHNATTIQSFEITNAEVGAYEVIVAALSYAGIAGPSITGFFNLATDEVSALPSPLAPPFGLRDKLTGTSAFTTSDLVMVWEDAASNINNQTTRIQHWQVTIKDGTTVLSIEDAPYNSLSSLQEHIYTYVDNVGDGGPRRTFTVEIRGVDLQNRLTTPLITTFTNPAPAVPANVVVDAAFGNNFITYTWPTDPDFEGTLVWASTSASFTPSQANLIYEGKDTFIVHSGVDEGVDYYYRIAHYDTFGKSYSGTGLNLTAAIKVTSLTLDVNVNKIPNSSFENLQQTVTGTISNTNKVDRPIGWYTTYTGADYTKNTGRNSPNAVGIKATAASSNRLAVTQYATEGNVNNLVQDQDYVVSIYARKAVGLSTATKLDISFSGTEPNEKTELANPVLSSTFQRYAWKVKWTGTPPTNSSFSIFPLTAGGTLPAIAINDTMVFDDAQFEVGAALTGYAPKVGEISPGSITESMLAPDSVSSPKIIAGAVVAGKIAADAVAANNIQAGAVTAAKINVSQLSAISANMGSLTAGWVHGGAFSGGAFTNAWAWPPVGNTTGGFHLSTEGLLLGNNPSTANTNYLQFSKKGEIYSRNFSVDAAGNAVFNSGSFRGTIYADAGYFNGELRSTTGTFGGVLTGSLQADKVFVNTIHVAGNAITVPVSVYANNEWSFAAPNYVEISSLGMNCSGGQVMIIAGLAFKILEDYDGNIPSIEVVVTRDDGGWRFNTWAHRTTALTTVPIGDWPGAGWKVWRLYVKQDTTYGIKFSTLTARGIFAMETKR